MPVRGGQKSYVKLEGAKNNRLLTEKGRGGDIEVKIELEPSVDAPVAKGRILGHAVFSLDGETLMTKELYACEEVKQKTFGFSLGAFGRRFFAI